MIQQPHIDITGNPIEVGNIVSCSYMGVLRLGRIVKFNSAFNRVIIDFSEFGVEEGFPKEIHRKYNEVSKVEKQNL